MNICYSCDAGGFRGLEASVYSLLTHNKNINLYVLSMHYERDIKEECVIQVFPSITDEQKERLKKIIAYLDPHGSRVVFIDMLDNYKELFANGCHENDGHSSPYAPLKLCFDKICLNIHDILYLDCDTIIQENIETMYYKYLNEIKKNKKCYAAYRISPGEDEGDYPGEMVASVLLFDLDNCRKTRFFERVRYNVTHKFYKWYEQSATEDTEDCVILPETYNYMELYEERKYEPAILHFANRLNPKIYFTTDRVFYQKYPHLKYIRDGLKLINDLNLKYRN